MGGFLDHFYTEMREKKFEFQIPILLHCACAGVCLCVLQVFRSAKSGHIENVEYTLVKLLSLTELSYRNPSANHWAISTFNHNKLDNSIPASETPLRSNLKI